MEFKDKIKLNKDYLDDNSIEQPELYNETANAWAQAVLERDRAKERMTVSKAECEDEVRKNPAAFGWTDVKPPTVGWFENKALLHPKYRAAVEEHLLAAYNVNILAGGKETLDHRGKQLEVLSKLYTGSYFSSRPKEMGREAIAEASRKAQQEHLAKSSRLIKKKAE